MNRASKLAACLVAATVLLPASAEARRRFGGSSSVVTTPTTTRTSRGMIIVPVIGASRARAAEADGSRRVPFPSATTQQPETTTSLLRLTSRDETSVWCRSEVVVGGFCILN